MCVSKTYKKNIIISVKRLKKSAIPFVFQNGIADFFKLCCKYNRQTKYKNKTSKPKYLDIPALSSRVKKDNIEPGQESKDVFEIEA